MSFFQVALTSTKCEAPVSEHNTSVTNVNGGSKPSGILFGRFLASSVHLNGPAYVATPGPTKCHCGIRCHGRDRQSAANTAGFRDVACAWTDTGGKNIGRRFCSAKIM